MKNDCCYQTSGQLKALKEMDAITVYMLTIYKLHFLLSRRLFFRQTSRDVNYFNGLLPDPRKTVYTKAQTQLMILYLWIFIPEHLCQICPLSIIFTILGNSEVMDTPMVEESLNLCDIIPEKTCFFLLALIH